MNSRKLLWIVLAWAVLPIAVSAEEATPVVNKLEAVDCFADGLYQFQSVQVSVGPELDAYKAGETIRFSGNIINENSYPVVDGNVYVRISKVNVDAEDINITWHDVVDEFVALSDVAVNGSSTKPVEFSWKIPSSLGKGDYRSDYFFSVDKRFNLGGLPFTNEIVIGTAYFSINNTTETTFELDREGTLVNGEVYKHIGDWPIIEPDSAVTFTQPLKNSSDKDLTFNVSYDLYYWDSLRSEDKIDSKTETVTVPANKSVNLSYVINSAKESVYYLKITAKSGDVQSIVNLRTTSDIAKMRLNYPAINNFPILKGEETTLYSCFHMTSNAVANGKLVLTLTDKKDNVISTGEYSTEITGYMDAAAIKFTTDKDYGIVKLKAELFDENNKVVDQYETVYDCSEIGGTECQAFIKVQATTAVDYMEIALILLIALVSILITVRIKKLDNTSHLRKGLFIILIVLIVILVALVVRMTLISVDVKEVGAEDISSDQRIKTETKSGIYAITGFSGDRPITRGKLDVTHFVKLNINPDRLQTDGSWLIKKGQDFTLNHFSECKFSSGDGAWDTPICGAAQRFESYKSKRFGYVEFPSYTEPAKTVTSSNTNSISCIGMLCMADEVGCSNIKVKVDSFSKSPRACATWGNDSGSGVACTKKDISVGPLKYDGHSQNIILSTTGATVGSYTTSPWKVCVYEDGVCGSANGRVLSTTPKESEACDIGTYRANPTFSDLTYEWTCVGLNGGADVSCSAIKNAACGTASGKIVSEQPTGTAACAAGFSITSKQETSTEFKWKCVNNIGVGDSVSCSATKLITPVCGTTVGVCNSGTSSGFTQNDTEYQWKCTGNAEFPIYCRAPKDDQPVCGGIHGTNYSQPSPGTTGACYSGTFSEVTDTPTQYLWNCVNGEGITANCYSNKVDFGCGSANGTTVSTTPSGSDACIGGSVGTRSETSTTYNWNCVSSSGQTVTCSANKTPVANLSANCSVSTRTVYVPGSVTYTGSASNGSGGYTYNWSGAVTGTGQTKTRTFSTLGSVGTYSANLSVTDGSGNSDSDPCPDVEVRRRGGDGNNDDPISNHPIQVQIYYENPGTPAIVPNVNEKCTVSFVPESASSGLCEIKDVSGNIINEDEPLSYGAEGDESPITFEVNPQNRYTVTCTDDLLAHDGVTRPSNTSTILECRLVGGIVEQ